MKIIEGRGQVIKKCLGRSSYGRKMFSKGGNMNGDKDWRKDRSQYIGKRKEVLKVQNKLTS